VVVEWPEAAGALWKESGRPLVELRFDVDAKGVRRVRTEAFDEKTRITPG
jgi:hypothetical protein